MASKGKVIYARGFPYGAPMVWLRGGGTRDPWVKTFLKACGFYWNPTQHGWESAMYKPELWKLLSFLQSQGCEIQPKSGMDPNYVIDLEADYARA